MQNQFKKTLLLIQLLSFFILSLALFSFSKISIAETPQKNDSIDYVVKEQWKKDDSFTNSEESVNWSFSTKKAISKETWPNLKDSIHCEFSYKNIKRCEVVDLSKNKDKLKSDRYNPFNLSIELNESAQICQRAYVKDGVSILEKFTFQKIDIPTDTLERARNIGEQLSCIPLPKKPVVANNEIKPKDKKSELEQKAKAEEEAKKAEAVAAAKTPEATKAPEAAKPQEENKDLFNLQLNNTEAPVVNKPTEFTVEVKPHNGKLSCGINIAMGDGKSQNFYVTDKENTIHYSYAYSKPGNYEVKVDGKTFVKGWTGLAMPCTGNKKTMMVTVGENKAELEQKAKEEEAALAKKAELEQEAKAEAEQKAKAEADRKAKEENKDLFNIQLNAEQVIANKPAEFTVEVKANSDKLNCGISLATGDGKSQNFYVTEKENPVHYSYQYEKPGNYEVKVDGKTFIKGLKLVLPCSGNKKSMMVTVEE